MSPARSQTSVWTSSWNVAAADALGDEREHHVPAVAVGESLAGRELLREAVEGGQERLGLGERMQRQGEDVVVDLPVAFLVEVVADTGGVGEQVLDRDRVVDQRQVVAEDRTHEVLEAELAGLDESHDHERGEALVAACGRDAGARGVRNAEGAVREPLAALERALVADIDGEHAGERLRLDGGVKRLGGDGNGHGLGLRRWRDAGCARAMAARSRGDLSVQQTRTGPGDDASNRAQSATSTFTEDRASDAASAESSCSSSTRGFDRCEARCGGLVTIVVAILVV